MALRNSPCLFLLLCGVLLVSPARAGSPSDPLQPHGTPYGPGSSWVVGERLFNDGKAEEALPFLHMAYRHAPDVPAVALTFQAALQTRGYFDDAVEVLDGLVEAYPDSLRFRFERARTLIRMGHNDEALADLSWLEGRPGATEEMASLEASLLAARGRTEEALGALRRSLDRFPDRAEAIFMGMATVLERAQRPADALEVLAEGLQRFPRAVGLHMATMRLQAALDQPDAAMAAAVRADSIFALPRLGNSASTDSLQADPVDLPSSFRIELADLFLRNGSPDRGLEILRGMDRSGELDLAPSLYLARGLVASGRQEAGRALIARILQRWPDAGRAYFLAGQLDEEDGHTDSALANFRRAVELSPRDPEIRLAFIRSLLVAWDDPATAVAADTVGQDFKKQVDVATVLIPAGDHVGQTVLGYALRRLGQHERAAEWFARGAEDSTLRFNALIQASVSWDEAGRADLAREALETLRKENPHNPEIANSLGYFLAEKNMELDEAQRLVDEALGADPSNGAYLDSMGWVRFRQGSLDEAFDFLIRAVNAMPDDPVILEHLGLVLQGLDRPDEAQAMFKRALAAGGQRDRLEELIHAVTQANER